ncbi:MAG: hypothetical protein IJC72_03410 [Clostridia bacterium]|nr:hypothetical protein [Clostridia bacterium]
MELECKNCGAHEFQKSSSGTFVCKYCKTTLIMADSQNEDYSRNIPTNTNEYKRALYFCAKNLINDFQTPTDVLNLKILSFTKNKQNNCFYYLFNFEYANKKYFIKFSNDVVIEKQTPKAPPVCVPYFEKTLIISNIKFLSYLAFAIFLTPVFVVFAVIKMIEVANKRSAKVEEIYKENKKIKNKNLEEFIKKHNLL